MESQMHVEETERNLMEMERVRSLQLIIVSIEKSKERKMLGTGSFLPRKSTDKPGQRNVLSTVLPTCKTIDCSRAGAPH